MSDTARRRILLVEDEESLAGSIRYSLEQEGFTVTVAVDGRKAIERFRSDGRIHDDTMLEELFASWAEPETPEAVKSVRKK